MGEMQRLSVDRASKRRIGVLAETEIWTLEKFIDSIGLDVVEELEEIRQGKKKKEETNIDLELDVLNSLSNAVRALASFTDADS